MAVDGIAYLEDTPVWLFELEWENTFTFRFNRYISSRVFIYPRFDDGVSRDDHYAFWQLKEFASIGFQYSF